VWCQVAEEGWHTLKGHDALGALGAHPFSRLLPGVIGHTFDFKYLDSQRIKYRYHELETIRNLS